MKEMNSPEFKNRYAGFAENYKAGSTVQNARTAMADFNITAMELGKITLPAVNGGLKDLKGCSRVSAVFCPARLSRAEPPRSELGLSKALSPAGSSAFLGAQGVSSAAHRRAALSAERRRRRAIPAEVTARGKPAAPGSGVIRSVTALGEYAQTHKPGLASALQLLKSDEKHETAGARYERRMVEHAAPPRPHRKPSWRRWRCRSISTAARWPRR